jgi:Uma2 family endonuclease
MVASSTPMTAETLLRMSGKGVRYELIEGALKTREPAGHNHGRIAATVTGSLIVHVHAHQLGVVYAAETGFLISRDPDTVRAPDVAFVRWERAEQSGSSSGYFPGAPDLAVEVISPGDTYGEVDEKAAAWLHAGTEMVLCLNPRYQTVTIYKSPDDITILTREEILDGGSVVPGWRVEVGELFR